MAILHVVYKLLFSRDTFLTLKRYYLKYSHLFVLTLPFWDFSKWLQPALKLNNLIVSPSYLLPEIAVSPTVSQNFSVWQIALGIYILVTLALFLKFVYGISKIIKIRIKHTSATIQGTKVILLTDNFAPFSFLHWIFINPRLHTEAELSQILTHERIHVVQNHTIDILISELICIAFWANPFVWLLKKEIKENLEYIADNKVVKAGFDIKNYQYHLLNLSFDSPNYNFTNKFNVSPLKKRIQMMNRKKSQKLTASKYLAVIPLALLLLVLSNLDSIAHPSLSTIQTQLPGNEQVQTTNIGNTAIETNLQESNSNSQDVIPSKPETEKITGSDKISEVTVVGYATNPSTANLKSEQQDVQDEETVFQVVEKMPEYPGGQTELMKYLAQTVRYPVKAQELGIQGKVILSFVVNTDGSIDDEIKVLRSVNTVLDNEAIRVVKGMPKWTPGMQRGKHVRVNYTLPINFRLQANDTEGKPLLLIDGVEKPADFDMNSINTDQIQEVNVLKGETATKLYGEKGKHGAVLIKMKN